MKVRSAKLTIAISILLIEPRVLGEDAKSIRDLVLAEMPEIQSVKNFDELSEVLQQNIIKLSPKTLNSLLSYCEKDFSEKISSLNKPELIFENKQKFLFRKELWGGIKYDFEKDLFSAVIDKQSQELKTQAPIGVYWLLNGPQTYFVSKTKLHVDAYDKFINNFVNQWDGTVDNDELVLLRLCIMNPFINSKEMKTSFMDEFIELLQNALKEDRL